MIAVELVAGEPDVCPHPRKRRQHRITIFPSHGPLTLCINCFRAFKRMVRQWDAQRLTRDQVYRWFERAGWPRSDADAFITQTLEAA